LGGIQRNNSKSSVHRQWTNSERPLWRRDETKENTMADINNIVEELSKLTVLEAAELVKALETKWV